MTQADPSRSETADLALAAYLEPVLRDQRVLLIDAVDGPLTGHLAAVAETLQVVAPEEIEIFGKHADAQLELPLEVDLFDLIWVTDVSLLPDPRARAVDAFRNALIEDGVLVLCAEVEAGGRPKRRRTRGNPAASLGRLAGGPFEEVRVLSQSAFDGFALDTVDGDEQGDTGLDQSLVGGDPPKALRHVAIASDLLPRLEARLVVRVPDADAPVAVASEPDPELLERLREAEAAAEEHREEAAALRADARDLDDELEDLRESLAAALEQRDAAQVDLDKLRERSASDKQALKDAKADAKRLVRDLEEARRDRVDPAELKALQDEIVASEERLRESGRRVVELEAEVERRATVARDLMADMERIQAAAPPASAPALESSAHDPSLISDELDAHAEREAAVYAADELRTELAAAKREAQARIDRLEAELEDARSAAPSAPDPASAVVEEGQGHVPGSDLIARDSEQVRAMGAELLTYRQQLAERDQLSAELAERERELSEQRGYAAGLRLRLAEAEQALAQSTVTQAAAPALRDADEEERIASLTAEIEQLREAFDDQRADADALAGDLHDAQQQIKELSAELAEADRVSGDEADVAAERDTLAEQVHQLRERVSDLEEALREADDEMEQLRSASQQPVARTEEEVTLRSEVEAARSRITQLEEEVEQARQDATAAEHEVSARLEMAQRKEQEARQERDQARAGLAEARALLQQVATYFSPQGGDVSALAQALEGAGADSAQRRELLDRLQEQLGDRESPVEG